MESLFVYGNLMEPAAQKMILGRATEWNYDVLFDYIKINIPVQGRSYTTIVPKRGYSIGGRTLYITPEELKKIDELSLKYYQRIKLKLNSGEEAWVYVK